MSFIKFIGLTPLFFMLGCSGGGGSSAMMPTDTHTAVYEENLTINNQNPDRGLYDASFELQKDDKDYNIFKYTKRDGYTLAFAKINLNAYIDTKTIPNDVINTIEKHLKEAEDVGVKLILRITYRNLRSEDDPSLNDIILPHLEQLKPSLQKYKDIISVVQAGIIGAWGEWHSFTGDFEETNANYKQNRRDIVEKLAEIFPNKYIQIRQPMQKELLYGEYEKEGDTTDKAKITQTLAYTQDMIAKLGHHNDCFVSSITDTGTYDSANVEFWKDYVANDSKYTPVGGESCENNQTFTNCTNTLNELKRLQYSFLNGIYKEDVIQKWKDDGCYDEIKNNLGYRLVASYLDIKTNDKSLDIELSITNKGFAAPYTNPDITFILQDENNTYAIKQSNLDLRTFYPNETKIIKTSFILDDIKSGNYSLYLGIGSSYSAIRLSNSNMWDVNTSTNKLLSNIKID
jgi:hypothetical protein